MNYTKSPWHTIEVSPMNEKRKSVNYLCNKSAHLHAIIEGASDDDLRLISAAPDLFEALEMVLNNNKVMNALDRSTATRIMNAISLVRGE